MLPENLFDSKKIEILSLSNNKFKELPNKVGKLSKLKYLNLEFNYFKDLPEELLLLEDLEMIKVGGNSLSKSSRKILKILRDQGTKVIWHVKLNY